jgi:hypothetical protein
MDIKRRKGNRDRRNHPEIDDLSVSPTQPNPNPTLASPSPNPSPNKKFLSGLVHWMI